MRNNLYKLGFKYKNLFGVGNTDSFDLIEDMELDQEYTPLDSDTINKKVIVINDDNDYKFKKLFFQISNDYEKDGFMYDKISKKIRYGSISIYAVEHNGNYYDVVTSKIIPRGIICQVSSLDDNSKKEVNDNIDLARKHLDLYNLYIEHLHSNCNLAVNQKQLG